MKNKSMIEEWECNKREECELMFMLYIEQRHAMAVVSLDEADGHIVKFSRKHVSTIYV